MDSSICLSPHSDCGSEYGDSPEFSQSSRLSYDSSSDSTIGEEYDEDHNSNSEDDEDKNDNDSDNDENDEDSEDEDSEDEDSEDEDSEDEDSEDDDKNNVDGSNDDDEPDNDGEDYTNDSTIINHHTLTQHKDATSLHSMQQSTNSHLQRSTQWPRDRANPIGTTLSTKSKHSHHQDPKRQYRKSQVLTGRLHRKEQSRHSDEAKTMTGPTDWGVEVTGSYGHTQGNRGCRKQLGK